MQFIELTDYSQRACRVRSFSQCLSYLSFRTATHNYMITFLCAFVSNNPETYTRNVNTSDRISISQVILKGDESIR